MNTGCFRDVIFKGFVLGPATGVLTADFAKDFTVGRVNPDVTALSASCKADCYFIFTVCEINSGKAYIISFFHIAEVFSTFSTRLCTDTAF